MIDDKRWRSLSLAQQLGNIGSELARARHWQERGDRYGRERALERALDLIARTIDDPRWRSGVKELTRFGEVVAAWFAGAEDYDVDPEALVAYCVGFSLHRPDA